MKGSCSTSNHQHVFAPGDGELSYYMPLVIFRCFHKAVAIIYKPQVTSLHCMLKLTKTYFKDSEKQGRLAVVCQAALEGWGWCLLSHCGFPQGSSNSTHRAGGSILGDEVTSWG